jgi:hypothetical protein
MRSPNVISTGARSGEIRFSTTASSRPSDDASLLYDRPADIVLGSCGGSWLYGERSRSLRSVLRTPVGMTPCEMAGVLGVGTECQVLGARCWVPHICGLIACVGIRAKLEPFLLCAGLPPVAERILTPTSGRPTPEAIRRARSTLINSSSRQAIEAERTFIYGDSYPTHLHPLRPRNRLAS